MADTPQPVSIAKENRLAVVLLFLFTNGGRFSTTKSKTGPTSKVIQARFDVLNEQVKRYTNLKNFSSQDGLVAVRIKLTKAGILTQPIEGEKRIFEWGVNSLEELKSLLLYLDDDFEPKLKEVTPKKDDGADQGGAQKSTPPTLDYIGGQVYRNLRNSKSWAYMAALLKEFPEGFTLPEIKIRTDAVLKATGYKTYDSLKVGIHNHMKRGNYLVRIGDEYQWRPDFLFEVLHLDEQPVLRARLIRIGAEYLVAQMEDLPEDILEQLGDIRIRYSDLEPPEDVAKRVEKLIEARNAVYALAVQIYSLCPTKEGSMRANPRALGEVLDMAKSLRDGQQQLTEALKEDVDSDESINMPLLMMMEPSELMSEGEITQAQASVKQAISELEKLQAALENRRQELVIDSAMPALEALAKDRGLTLTDLLTKVVDRIDA